MSARHKLNPVVGRHTNQTGRIVSEFDWLLAIGQLHTERLENCCREQEQHVTCKRFTSTQSVACTKRKWFVLGQQQFSVGIEQSFGLKYIWIFPELFVLMKLTQRWQNYSFLEESTLERRIEYRNETFLPLECCIPRTRCLGANSAANQMEPMFRSA